MSDGENEDLLDDDHPFIQTNESLPSLNQDPFQNFGTSGNYF